MGLQVRTQKVTIVSERFHTERFNTPTGRMLLVTDDEQRVRAADWEDKADRMQRLLRLHYGENDLQLQERRTGSRARLALKAYFDGQPGRRSHPGRADRLRSADSRDAQVVNNEHAL
jgi:methylated-DNA-[protein]-cysteine S-methyltransferase